MKKLTNINYKLVCLCYHKTNITSEVINLKNTKSNILWGIIFILVGLGFFGKIFGIWNFNFNLFDGWWTFIIIVPCCISLFSHGPKKINTIGLSVGLVLLLDQTNIIRGISVFDLCIPLILIGIGVSFFIQKNEAFTSNKKSDISDSKSEQFDKGGVGNEK